VASAPQNDLLAGGTGSAMADLLGLDLTLGADTTPAPAIASNNTAAAASGGGGGSLLDLFGGADAATDPFASTPTPTPTTTTAASDEVGKLKEGGPIDVALRVLTAKDDGVLYEDASLQIGVKSTFADGRGQLTLFLGNKTAAPLTGFACRVVTSVDGVAIGTHGSAPAQLPPQTQTQLPLTGISASSPFADAPLLAVRYANNNNNSSSSTSFSLRTPLVPTKFCAPVDIDAARFFTLWAQLDSAATAHQAVLQAGKPVSIEFCRLLLGAARLASLNSVDPNTVHVVSMWILTCSLFLLLLFIHVGKRCRMWQICVCGCNGSRIGPHRAECTAAGLSSQRAHQR
jgi:AP-2 complex subunit alpha